MIKSFIMMLLFIGLVSFSIWGGVTSSLAQDPLGIALALICIFIFDVGLVASWFEFKHALTQRQEADRMQQ